MKKFYLVHLKGFSSDLLQEVREEKFQSFLQESLSAKISIEKPHFYSGSLIVTFLMHITHEETMKTLVETLITDPHMEGASEYKKLYEKIFPAQEVSKDTEEVKKEPLEPV